MPLRSDKLSLSLNLNAGVAIPFDKDRWLDIPRFERDSKRVSRTLSLALSHVLETAILVLAFYVTAFVLRLHDAPPASAYAQWVDAFEQIGFVIAFGNLVLNIALDTVVSTLRETFKNQGSIVLAF